MTVKDVIKEISVRWSLMDDESKQPYVERAQRDKIRFESEMRVYKDHKEPKNAHYSHPEENCDVASNHPKLSPSLHTNIDQASQHKVEQAMEVEEHSNAIMLKDDNEISNNDGADNVEESIIDISKHINMQHKQQVPNISNNHQHQNNIDSFEIQPEPCQVDKSKKFQYGSHEVDGSKQQINFDSQQQSVPFVKWSDLSVPAYQSGVTVADNKFGSLDFDDDYTQIPSGCKKTFCELIESSFQNPLSFLDVSRNDYVSLVELSFGGFCVHSKPIRRDSIHILSWSSMESNDFYLS